MRRASASITLRLPGLPSRLPMNAVLLSMIFALAAGRAAPELIAHRGESADAPENTLAAFQLAWERGDDAIELDVHLSRDGQLVLSHDADTERTAGVKRIIKASTWDQLKDLDVGTWKDPKFAGERLHLLADALATVPAGKRCFIEVKVGPEAIPPLVEVIAQSGLRAEQLPIIAFKAETIAEAKRLLPEHKAYWLAKFKKDDKTGRWVTTIEELIATAKQVHADGLDLSFDGPFDAAAVRKVRDAGLELYFWTVDDPAAARKLIELGADGITTNKAAWMREQLQRSTP